MVNFEQSPKGKQGTNKSRDDDAEDEEENEEGKGTEADDGDYFERPGEEE